MIRFIFQIKNKYWQHVVEVVRVHVVAVQALVVVGQALAEEVQLHASATMVALQVLPELVRFVLVQQVALFLVHTQAIDLDRQSDVDLKIVIFIGFLTYFNNF